MNLDAIRSYLVELGVEVDNDSFKAAEKALNTLEKAVTKTVNGIAKVFKSIVKTQGLLTALATSIYKFNSSIAQNDLEMQKFAKSMFMTEDSAKSLQRTLDAMGLSGIEDLKHVALSPELTRYYKDLRELSMSLSNDQSTKDGLRDMREISHQFAKIRVTLSYLMDKITAAFTKVFRSTQGRSFMKLMNDINTKLVKNIDKIAETIAKVMNLIVSVFVAVSRVGSRIYDWFSKLPSIVKSIGAAITLITLAFIKSPLGATLLALFILLEDYIGYKAGADSSKTLKPVWDALDKGIDYVKDLFAKAKVIFNDVKAWMETSPTVAYLKELGKEMISVTKDIYKYIIDNFSISGTINTIKDWFKEVVNILQTIYDYIYSGLEKLANSIYYIKDKFKDLLDAVKEAIKLVKSKINSIVSPVKSLFGFGDDTEKEEVDPKAGVIEGALKGLDFKLPESSTDLTNNPILKDKFGGSITNHNTGVTQNININVNGAKEPKAVADEISLSLYRQYQNGAYA